MVLVDSHFHKESFIQRLDREMKIYFNVAILILAMVTKKINPLS